jgi:4-hydroxybenzoyl-CoA thioesterase
VSGARAESTHAGAANAGAVGFSFRRAVRFEEVDAARIVFFARYFYICHDAMEAFFGGLEGGYASIITKRGLGLPAVHAECDFPASLRYGDVVVVNVSVVKVGTTSITFRFVLSRESDGVVVGRAMQTSVLVDLESMKKMPIPDDIRAQAEAHLER